MIKALNILENIYNREIPDVKYYSLIENIYDNHKL